MDEYAGWFEGSVGEKPHTWQLALATDARCRDRMIRIPTGFGKRPISQISISLNAPLSAFSI